MLSVIVMECRRSIAGKTRDEILYTTIYACCLALDFQQVTSRRDSNAVDGGSVLRSGITSAIEQREILTRLRILADIVNRRVHSSAVLIIYALAHRCYRHVIAKKSCVKTKPRV